MPTPHLISYHAGDMRCDAQELAALSVELEAARQTLKKKKAAGEIGFLSIPGSAGDLKPVTALAAKTTKNFRHLIVVGIGGSDLGARAFIKALARPGKGMEVHFIGASTDPDEIAALLDRIDLAKAAINVISKSGDTIEPMSTFLLLRKMLVAKVGAKKHARHIIATTDEKSGTLRTIADREGYATLPVPPAIGGRFSALTPVGFFPAACAGIKIVDLIAGAADADDQFWSASMAENPAALFAGLHRHLARRDGRRVTVLMPYAEALREVSNWFRQLWAESLGKRSDSGFTPVAAIGAADQHSQLQLWTEGPADAVITFLEVEKFKKNFAVPNAYPDIEGVAYMDGHTFEEIIHAERKATAMALTKAGRPNGTLTIGSVSAKSVGAVMYMCMLATAVAGEIMEVNAYDQPGVESMKRAMYALLGRKGYEL
ncbi:glucose-6-phosphate isomerase [Candidatus Uhrbacteria bacterium]|nr:glucose-6-phosphate isomerase [Candidatus Uhrbacteria bacterium]